jgi:hypothetical protein
VLRTSAGRTLALAAALNDAGFKAWTPTEIEVRRARRSFQREEIIIPLTPSLVFAGYDRVANLVTLSHSPPLIYQVWDDEKRRMVTRGYPYFTVFLADDQPAFVPDAQLKGLRQAEGRRMARVKSKSFKSGDRVRLTEGAFAGLTGVVDSIQGRFARVSFAEWRIVTSIAVWLLYPAIDTTGSVHVNAAPDKQAQLAKAA